MFVDRIEIQQLRCFVQTAVDFLHPDRPDSSDIACPNVTLLLGNNGAGKSSVLRAVALSALAPVVQSSGYVPFSMVRRAHDIQVSAAVMRGTFCLHPQDGDGSSKPVEQAVTTEVLVRRRGTTEFLEVPSAKEPYWERMYDDRSPAFLVLGYGATRRVEGADSLDLAAREKNRLLRYQRVAGLFEEHITMVPLAAWLPGLETSNPGRYTQVLQLLSDLLPEGTDFRGERDGHQYLFDHRGVKVAFGAMSDGFRQYVGWIGDLLYHVCMGCPPGQKLVENHGIVLIDEVDLHLHPDWQRTVIPLLSRILPNLQFILSSHSPIVVGTLHKENVVVFDTAQDGSSFANKVHTEVFGLNADQVLTSTAFGLTSSRSPEFVRELKQTSMAVQRGDRAAEARFQKMMLYGSGGDAIQEKLDKVPADVIDASRKLRAVLAPVRSAPRRPAIKARPQASKRRSKRK